MSEEENSLDETPRLTVTGGFSSENSYQVSIIPYKIEEMTIYQLSYILLEMIERLTDFWTKQIADVKEDNNR